MDKNAKNKKSAFVPILILGLIILSFVSGSLWQKVKTLEKGNNGTVAGTKVNQQQPTQPELQVSLDQIKKLFTKDYLSFGDAQSKVLFVEFSDPSCPYCHVAAGTNPELNQQIGPQFQLDTKGGSYMPPVREMRKLVDSGKASYVMIYRNGHGNGILATQALYCAYEKGKFWEVHDLLMSNTGYELVNNQVTNDKTKIPALVDFLKGAVDPTYLNSCLESEKYADKLNRDTQIGDSLGVGGTPGFFINTKGFPGAYSYKEMEQTVKSALEG